MSSNIYKSRWMITQQTPRSSNFPPSPTEREAIDLLVNSNLYGIKDITRILEHEIASLELSEALLARIEGEMTSLTKVLDVYDAQRELFVQEKEVIDCLKAEAIAERSTLADVPAAATSHAFSDILVAKFDASLSSLKSHSEMCQNICDTLEQQIRRLRGEQAREELLIATRRDTISLHRDHLDSLRRIQTSLTRRCAPQFRVPVEVWSHIFADCIQATIDDFLENPAKERMAYMPLRLAQVCSLWRQTLLASPRLWTTISLPSTIGNEEADTPLLPYILGLCQSQHLKFVLNLGEINLASGDCAGITCKIPTMEAGPQNKHLHVITPIRSDDNDGREPPSIKVKCGFFVDSLTYQERQPAYRGQVDLPFSPNLDYVRVQPGPISRPAMGSIAVDIDMPSSWSLNELAWFLQLSAPSLRRLRIRSTFRNRSSTGRILGFPELRTLGVVLHHNVGLRRIDAPNLSKLILYQPKEDQRHGDCGNCLDGLQTLLEEVTTIECMGWSHIDSPEYKEILSVVARFARRLNMLRFIECAVDGRVLEGLLQGRPNVKLALDRCRGITQVECETLGRLVQRLAVVL
ncbi:hypothetical protein FRC17_006047 [Serendipita sp. 399]|nr:hypothetical protein FRC17_006047 [Serendipita sp. 399]